MKLTLGHVDEPLRWEGAVALVGGSALYIAAQVLFKRRSLGTFGIQRVVTAIVLLALIVPAHSIDAIVTLAAVAVVLWALIAFEGVRYAATRDRLGHTPERQPVGNPVHDERPVGRAN